MFHSLYSSSIRFYSITILLDRFYAILYDSVSTILYLSIVYHLQGQSTTINDNLNDLKLRFINIQVIQRLDIEFDPTN